MPGDFRALSTELLRSGHAIRFRASGPSMAPAIRDGDIVTVDPERVPRVSPGDVVLFESERGPTAHRVIELAGRELVVRGDAAGSEMERVHADRVLGAVVRVHRNGSAVSWQPSPWKVFCHRILRRLRAVTAPTRRATGRQQSLHSN